MNQKTEIAIFFSALVLIGAALYGGIAYFKPQGTTGGLLADIGTTVQPQDQNNQDQNNVETIPTSTIVVPTAASSSVASPLDLPYAVNASTSNEIYWPKAWGNTLYIENGLALVPDPTTHGANSFLNGASLWANYAVRANVSWLQGGWFDIVARVTNNTRDFVYCEFGSNGTEIIERVNTVDTQLAFTSASTTNVQGATESFGMKVHGNDIGCMMADREVLGVQVTKNESPTGGIGFVIFGQPQDQKQVKVTDVSVSPLLTDTIEAPFPVPPPPPPPPPAPAPAPTPVVTAPAPAPAPTPAATTTKTLPYSTTQSFSKTDGWNTWWGNFTFAPNSLTISTPADNTRAGVLLDGTNAWSDYTFQTTLDWVKGEQFGLIARYTNAQNYVVCEFDEPFVGEVDMTLKQFINGNEYTLVDAAISNYNQAGGTNINAYIQVQGTQGGCSFNNHTVTTVSLSNGLTLNPPFNGRIGFNTYDPSPSNSEIVVKSVSVASNY